MHKVLILQSKVHSNISGAIFDAVVAELARNQIAHRHCSIGGFLEIPSLFAAERERGEYAGVIIIGAILTQSEIIMAPSVYRLVTEIATFNAMPMGYAVYNHIASAPTLKDENQAANNNLEKRLEDIGKQAANTCVEIINYGVNFYSSQEHVRYTN